MKKILTVLLAAAMMIVTPVGIFAETPAPAKTDADQELDKNPTSGKIELFANLASSYTLLLPLKLDVSTSGATANIYAKGDVDGDKKIVIAEDGSNHALKDKANAKTDVGVTIAFGSGIAGDTVKTDYDNGVKETMTVTHSGIKAGEWSCELPIVISLQNKTAQQN